VIVSGDPMMMSSPNDVITLTRDQYVVWTDSGQSLHRYAYQSKIYM